MALRKPTVQATKPISLEIKAPENQLSDLEANIRKVVAKASPEDWEALAKLVDNPARLAMARNFM